MTKFVQLAIWLLPASELKNRLLRRIGHEIGAGARIGPSLVMGVGKFRVGENCSIAPFNTFKGNSLIQLADESGIGSFNWISAHPAYQALDPGAGTLMMGYGARIEGRNYLDCSGTVEIGAYSAVGGQRCVLQSHDPDLGGFKQTVGRVVVGHHSLVGSCAVMLKGAELPPQSILAANATMTGRRITDPKSGVYGGTPAKFLAPTSGGWFEREGRDAIAVTDLKIDGVLGAAPTATPIDGVTDRT